jgi:hypothetical protein
MSTSMTFPHLRRWAAVATTGAALSLGGVLGVSPELAGAAASPGAAPINPGTYELFLNGNDSGMITFGGGHTFSTVEGSDSGFWMQAGETIGLKITSGNDADSGCVFAGHVNATGTGISNAAKPGNWICPLFHLGSFGGTFFVEPVAAGPTPPAHGDALSAGPATAGTVRHGTYNWTVTGGFPGGKANRHITLATKNTFSSTLTHNDSGTWVQGGSAVALSITGGADGDAGCLFVGKGNHAGTAVGTMAKPGNWICPSYATNGTFFTS